MADLDRKSMTHRTFVKAAAAGAIAAGGIEGILAARRAPALAQGPSCTVSAGSTLSRSPTSS